MAYEFIKSIHKEYKYCKKVINKHFNKNLIMSEKEEHLFPQSSSYWICKKLIGNNDEKVREKISDIDKYLYIEKGLRGGISYIAKRYAKAKNKYINEFDPKKESTFI